MDSKIALALMTKAMRVFEREGTFLSFPLAPTAFSPEQLEFAQSGISTNQDLLDLSEFSRLVNLLPDGVVWPPAEARLLWNVYSDTVHGAVQLAKATRTAEEDAAFDAAYSLLHESTPDGLSRDAKTFSEYKRCRDAVFVAEEDYNSRKISAELSGDPAAKQRWSDVEEPLLRQKLDILREEWNTQGYRTQIENALSTVTALGAKAPGAMWAKWGSLYNDELDTKTDTNQCHFAACSFSPSNVVKSGGWNQFLLSGPEADALIAASPPELRARLVPDAVDLEIASLSVELTSVAITRPWFVPDVFAARFWRFLGSPRMLSDGGELPKGDLPAFVAALVLARNLQIKPRPDSTRNEAVINRIKAGAAVDLGFVKINRVATTPGVDGSRGLLVAPLAVLPPRDVSSPRVAATVKASVATAVPLRATLATPAGPLGGPAMRAPASALMARRIQLNDFTRTALPAASATDAPPTRQPPPAPVPEVDLDTIYVMAFICKRVPLCPNPDSSLPW